jgi:uncharacterized membrane protein
MSQIALMNVVYIREIIAFMLGEMKELLAVRLVNRYWAESVEKYSVDVWRKLFSEYKEKSVSNIIYSVIQHEELNWMLYIWININIINENIFFVNKKAYILQVAVRFNNILLVKYLIEKNVNIEATDEYGDTA